MLAYAYPEFMLSYSFNQLRNAIKLRCVIYPDFNRGLPCATYFQGICRFNNKILNNQLSVRRIKASDRCFFNLVLILFVRRCRG